MCGGNNFVVPLGKIQWRRGEGRFLGVSDRERVFGEVGVFWERVDCLQIELVHKRTH